MLMHNPNFYSVELNKINEKVSPLFSLNDFKQKTAFIY